MIVPEIVLVLMLAVAAATAWLSLKRALDDALSARRRTGLSPKPAEQPDGLQRTEARIGKLARRLDALEGRLHDGIRVATARSARRADSIEGRLQDEVAYLKQEARSYEAVRSAEISMLLEEVQQLQVATRVLGGQLAELERETKHRVANLMEVRHQDVLRHEAERWRNLDKAINNLLAEDHEATPSSETAPLRRGPQEA